MTAIGSRIGQLLILLLALASGQASAQVTASLDRDQAVMGDTLKLTISTRGNENINNIDLRPLLSDFDILRRSTSSNTSIVNGQSTRTRQVMLDISPKREGTLRVPSLRVGNTESNMLLVAVGPPVSIDAGQARVLFEAEIDRSEIYVQGQVLLTLRIQQSINLDGRSISEVTLDNAFVKQLEQKSFQRTIDGRQWLIHEVRYAIFPEQSGTLEIPAQTFTGRESSARRSLFDTSSGKPLRITSDAIKIKVLPRPESYPTGDWLPAQRVTLEESWSVPPEQLKAGESATRTVRISGEGLQGAQLPPILFPSVDGLKYYPDQPIISDTEVGTGLLGSRQDSAALVPTRAGSWEIAEISVPWWDTQAQEVKFATLPARQIVVAPASVDDMGQPMLPPAIAQPSLPMTQAANASEPRVWQLVAAICGVGWLLTLIFWWRTRRAAPVTDESQTEHSPNEAQAYKNLVAACASGNCGQSRQGLIHWGAALMPTSRIVTLEDLNAAFDDAELQAASAELDAALYRGDNEPWLGDSLGQIVKRLRKQERQKPKTANAELRLYPA
ncbi:MAG: BatD family protein [Halioglobus sp.]